MQQRHRGTAADSAHEDAALGAAEVEDAALARRPPLLDPVKRAASVFCQAPLELFDRRDRRRVLAGEYREIDRDEITEQHERERALDVVWPREPTMWSRPPARRSARASARSVAKRAE